MSDIGNVATSTGTGLASGGLIGGAIGLGTGLLSMLFSGESEQSKAMKDLIAKIKQVQGYSRAEIDNSASQYDKAGQSAIMQTANDIAIGAVGRQNAQNAMVARMVPTVAMMGANRRANMEDYNKNLEIQKLQMEGQAIQGLSQDTPQQNFLTTVGLGIKGFQLGTQVDDLNRANEPISNGYTVPTANPINGMNQSFLGQTSIGQKENLMPKVADSTYMKFNSRRGWIYGYGGM